MPAKKEQLISRGNKTLVFNIALFNAGYYDELTHSRLLFLHGNLPGGNTQ
jgi:hypothetical protein